MLAHVGDHAIVAALVQHLVERGIHLVRHEHVGVGPFEILLLRLVQFLHVVNVLDPVLRAAGSFSGSSARSCCSTLRASPTIGTCTLTFLPISLGSMST